MVKWLFKRPDLPFVFCINPPVAGRMIEPLTKEDSPGGWRITIRTPSIAKGHKVILSNINKDWLENLGFVADMNSDVYFLKMGPGGKKIPESIGLQYITDPKNLVEDRDMEIVQDKLAQEEREFSSSRVDRVLKREAKKADIMRKKEQQQEKYGRQQPGGSDSEY